MINCLLCHNQAERHHIKSRGSGGSDEENNIMMLCRNHHTEIHKIGRTSFVEKYNLLTVMQRKGWEYVAFLNKWVYPLRDTYNG